MVKVVGIMLSLALGLAVLVAPVGAASSRVSLSHGPVGLLAPGAGDPCPGWRPDHLHRRADREDQTCHVRGRRWTKLNTFLDLRTRVNDPTQGGNNERGLLGLAFHPDYQRNGRFYVNYTRAGSGSKKGDTVVAEYRRATAGKADPASRRVLMIVNQPASNHNGGHLAFGPDGLLYIGLGDGGGAGDPRGNGQRLGTRLGKHCCASTRSIRMAADRSDTARRAPIHASASPG